MRQERDGKVETERPASAGLYPTEFGQKETFEL